MWHRNGYRDASPTISKKRQTENQNKNGLALGMDRGSLTKTNTAMQIPPRAISPRPAKFLGHKKDQ